LQASAFSFGAKATTREHPSTQTPYSPPPTHTHQTGIQHFDLAFDAFEQLAHPVFGATMLDYRPVDCDTRAPLPFEPGFISRGSILKSGAQAGWGWQTYGGRDFTLTDSASA
jgi:cullin-associated NEDD8-dissociated protein 1